MTIARRRCDRCRLRPSKTSISSAAPDDIRARTAAEDVSALMRRVDHVADHTRATMTSAPRVPLDDVGPRRCRRSWRRARRRWRSRRRSSRGHRRSRARRAAVAITATRRIRDDSTPPAALVAALRPDDASRHEVSIVRSVASSDLAARTTSDRVGSTQAVVRGWLATRSPRSASRSLTSRPPVAAGSTDHGRRRLAAAMLASAGFRPEDLAPEHAMAPGGDRRAGDARRGRGGPRRAARDARPEVAERHRRPSAATASPRSAASSGSRSCEDGRVTARSSGIGVNADWAAEDFPPELVRVDGQPARARRGTRRPRRAPRGVPRLA